VFVDESGFQLNMTPSYAYAPKGERAYGSVPKNRGENTSLLAAISLDEGVCAAMTLTGAVDGVAFEVYVKQVLCPKLRAGQIVVLDRLNVHKNRNVREAVEAKGCTMLFLPGYSPDLNPIELAFSKLKTWPGRGTYSTGLRRCYRRCAQSGHAARCHWLVRTCRLQPSFILRCAVKAAMGNE
jgi:transposase